VRTAAAGIVLALAALAGGCGVSDDRKEARATVERFYAAVDAKQGEDACSELSEDTVSQVESQSGSSCNEVITRLTTEGGEIAEAEVYVGSGQVTLVNGETAYLTKEPSGWKLTAIGCRAESGADPTQEPLDCNVEA